MLLALEILETSGHACSPVDAAGQSMAGLQQKISFCEQLMLNCVEFERNIFMYTSFI